MASFIDDVTTPRGTVRLIGTSFLILLLAAFIFPLQWLAWRFGWRLQRLLPMLFHRGVARIIDLRVKVVGTPSSARPMLILSNHVSWLDITALGTLMPLSFVAKSEVMDWPLFGLMAKLQRSIFVDRNRRSSTKENSEVIAARLEEGDPIVLFAESTTSDGNRILPFRSALVGAARAAVTSDSATTAVHIQPVSLAYDRADGLPTGRMGRARIGWYGDMEMIPHLKGILRGGPLDITISFGAPMIDDGLAHRKALTRDAEQSVRMMLAEGLTGRKALVVVDNNLPLTKLEI
jgi:lyso-ornithine lipid O-acyltransferase